MTISDKSNLRSCEIYTIWDTFKYILCLVMDRTTNGRKMHLKKWHGLASSILSLFAEYNIFDTYRWDTAGQEEYAEARKSCYEGTSILLIGFSLVEPDSLANVAATWEAEANLDKLRKAPVGQNVVFNSLSFFGRDCSLDWRRTWKMMTRSRKIWPKGMRWNIIHSG